MEENKFTINKATELLQSFSGLMKDGCVSRDIYNERRKLCESCDQNNINQSTKKHFCGGCGCGARPMAALYIEGVPVEEDHSVRLWMPKSNCPKNLHKDERGTGSFKEVGGRMKQLKEFTLSTLAESIGASRKDDPLTPVNQTIEIVESVSVDENELDELADIMAPEIEKISGSTTYNDSKEETNEKHDTHSSDKQQSD
jgi:hypothetical protein